MQDRQFWPSMEKLMRKARKIRNGSSHYESAARPVQVDELLEEDYGHDYTTGELLTDDPPPAFWDNWQSFVHDLNGNDFELPMDWTVS
jgi:hypothetical protein